MGSLTMGSAFTPVELVPPAVERQAEAGSAPLPFLPAQRGASAWRVWAKELLIRVSRLESSKPVILPPGSLDLEIWALEFAMENLSLVFYARVSKPNQGSNLGH